jgi:hypothetical protein
MKSSVYRNPRVIQLIGFLLVLGSLVMAAFGIHALILGLQTQTWPSAEGVILQSSAEHGSSARTSSEYYLNVQYRYSVGDQSYTGDNVTPGVSATLSEAEANDLISGRYAAGRPVPVYYDPQNPANAVLQPGIAGDAWLMIVVSVICAAGGGFLLRVTSRGRRQPRETSARMTR